MGVSWNEGLIYCSLVLLVPREKWNVGTHAVRRVGILFTIIGMTLLRPITPPIVLFAIALFVASLYIFESRSIALPLQLVLQAAVQGMVTAVFEYQLERVYPFQKLYGVPITLVHVFVVACLFVMFTTNDRIVWIVWSVFYVSWVFLEFVQGVVVSLTTTVEWFWCMELVLWAVVSLKGAVKALVEQNTRNIV